MFSICKKFLFSNEPYVELTVGQTNTRRVSTMSLPPPPLCVCPMIVSYTQRRTETVIYSPFKSRPALLLLLVKTFLTLDVTFTSLIYFMNENTLSFNSYTPNSYPWFITALNHGYKDKDYYPSKAWNVRSSETSRNDWYFLKIATIHRHSDVV